MTPWPQFTIAAWLCLTMGVALYHLLTPRKLTALTAKDQRRIAKTVMFSAIIEMVTLRIGGFWS